MNKDLEAMLRQVEKTYSRSNEHCHDENEAIIAYALVSIALSLEKIAASDRTFQQSKESHDE